MLQEANFAGLDKNALPLKMFAELFLSGGIGFDVARLFKSASNIWLISLLLNLRHLPSLTAHKALKKQLMIFVETEIYPFLTMKCLEKEFDTIKAVL